MTTSTNNNHSTTSRSSNGVVVVIDDDDQITIATTSDSSHDGAPAIGRKCCRVRHRETVKTLCRMPSFWFFIFSCVLLLLAVIVLPVVKSYYNNNNEYYNNNNNHGTVPNDGSSSSSTTTTRPPASISIRKPTMAPTPSPTTTRVNVMDYIQQHNLVTDYEVLEDTKSPEYRAAQFLTYSKFITSDDDETTNNNNYSNDTDEQSSSSSLFLIEFQERFAMAVLYYALGGDDVSVTYNWKYTPVHYNFASPFHHICEWQTGFLDMDAQQQQTNNNRVITYGVVCNPTNQRVEQITLFNNNLVGTLSKVPFHLFQDLKVLWFSNNPGLTGPFPTSLEQNHKLQILMLRGASLDGPIDTIELPDSLVLLDVARNFLTGSLPSRLPSSLQSLSLEDNFLSGSLDDDTTFERCTELRELYLENNRFQHTIVSETFLSSLSQLQELDLSDNPNIRGEVPMMALLWWWNNLEVLDLHDTGIEQFPSSDAILANKNINSTTTTTAALKFLALHQTPSLRGTVPFSHMMPELTFTQLTHLDLTSATGLTGDMSDDLSLSSMTSLRYLFLAHTNFTPGTVPLSSLQKLTNLVDVSFKNSRRTGPIISIIPNSSSSSINWNAMMTNLVLLDLEDNALTGNIPEELFHTNSNLQYVLLNRNQLNGTIPSSVEQAKNLKMLILNDNLLSGDVPNDSIASLKHLGKCIK